jgi:hypothetical protein
MSRITIFGDTSGKLELAVANTIPANLTFTLPSADGTAGQVLTTNGGGLLSFSSNDGTLSYGQANAAFAAANIADQRAVTSGSYANGAFASSNTKLSLTGGTITGNLTVTSNISTGNLTINDTINVHGVIVNWHEPAPLTSKGDPGDLEGYISIDDQKIYRCIQNYTNGANNIWVYVNFTGGTWG